MTLNLEVNVFFLRDGEWCKCERSCNTAAGRLECGVSVFECEDAGGGNWRGKGPAFTRREQVFKGQRRKLLCGRQTWYLVKGNCVGTGADGEPLLKTVTPHRIVVWDGEEFFQEKKTVQNISYKQHLEFPLCTCQAVQDDVQ